MFVRFGMLSQRRENPILDTYGYPSLFPASTYPGVTVRLPVSLGNSRVTLQLDFSFGNAITPAPTRFEFPALLLESAVHVNIYPIETVLAEKFSALAELGQTTTRMKDLYDLHIILNREQVNPETMREALQNSFQARGTPHSGVKEALAEDFYQDGELQNAGAPT